MVTHIALPVKRERVVVTQTGARQVVARWSTVRTDERFVWLEKGGSKSAPLKLNMQKTILQPLVLSPIFDGQYRYCIDRSSYIRYRSSRQ